MFESLVSMELNKEIFEKFLKNQCTDSEAEAVMAYLKEHPDELEKHIPLDDWLGEDKAPLDVEVSERMLRQVRGNYEPAKGARVRKLMVRYAVAAAFIGVIVLAGVKLFTRKAMEPVASAEINRDVRQLKTVENKTRQVMQVSLSDSSVATLYPNSSLQYLPGFENDKRDLYLKGTAQFKVASHPSRPFTVYAGGIGTTVLGTRFLVTEHPNKKVSVLLMEGRVRVWSQHKEDSNRSVILNPGDEVAVTGGRFNSYALVHKAAAESVLAGAKAVPVDTDSSLAFKNSNLKFVFKKLEEKFGVVIKDEKAGGIKDKLFTGKFLETDSLDFIVKTISNWYDLQYRIDGNIVTLTTK
ncbi:MAG: FecR domain-containing protein [Bacteroidetes bacterium]|nr:FecR domain-containing protein [Bacteroidota bacterium]